MIEQGAQGSRTDRLVQTMRRARFRSRRLRAPLVAARHRGIGPGDAFLVSYPRSGTTWMRFLVHEAITRSPADFEILYHSIPYIGRHRHARPLLERGGRVIFSHETHPVGRRRVVYIVRDPRSVLLSHYRFHLRRGEFGGSLERFVGEFLEGRTNTFGSWEDHVRFWTEEVEVDGDPLLIRFEDLRADPASHLSAVLRFLGVDPDDAAVAQAVENNSLERMRDKEDRQPGGRHFRRTINPDVRFVGTGSTTGWQQELQPDQIQRIESRLGPVMARFGYPSRLEG